VGATDLLDKKESPKIVGKTDLLGGEENRGDQGKKEKEEGKEEKRKEGNKERKESKKRKERSTRKFTIYNIRPTIYGLQSTRGNQIMGQMVRCLVCFGIW